MLTLSLIRGTFGEVSLSGILEVTPRYELTRWPVEPGRLVGENSNAIRLGGTRREEPRVLASPLMVLIDDVSEVFLP